MRLLCQLHFQGCSLSAQSISQRNGVNLLEFEIGTTTADTMLVNAQTIKKEETK
jgi:hypothetical protein